MRERAISLNYGWLLYRGQRFHIVEGNAHANLLERDREETFAVRPRKLP